ncbi:hypothetical protein DFH06DRAFT_104794 [Mycena polygramma]|nr:hypothetical protein DFH06DRAFT_104794 [Mycena polygramma]
MAVSVKHKRPKPIPFNHFEDLPAPAASQSAETTGPKHSKKRLRFRGLAFTVLLLWIGARYLCADVSVALYNKEEPAWPIPPDVSVEWCATWTNNGDVAIAEDFPYSASANFELPLSAAGVFLLARSVPDGHSVFATGNVHYLQSTDAGDSITVNITARYRQPEYLNASETCLLTRVDDQIGVGFFTNWQGNSLRRLEESKLCFEVTATFPATEDGSPLVLSQFSTDLPNLSQTFDDLSNVDFEQLVLASQVASIDGKALSANNASIFTSSAPIQIGSLVANDASVVTSTGSIDGAYIAFNSLTLKTTNSPITADVTLSSDAKNRDDTPATLRMLTSNGAITSKITLLSTSESGGAFNMSANTVYSPVDITVLAAPVDAVIALNTSNSQGQASVALPTTYEGAFTAFTTENSVDVSLADPEAKDPAGKGRHRRIDWEEKGRLRKTGRVGWSNEGRARGTVQVAASSGPVTLQF